VTVASSGIGTIYADQMARRGYDLFTTGGRESGASRSGDILFTEDTSGRGHD
jgi:short-subunit dehydrogenase